jgi:hypothetical protein
MVTQKKLQSPFQALKTLQEVVDSVVVSVDAHQFLQLIAQPQPAVVVPVLEMVVLLADQVEVELSEEEEEEELNDDQSLLNRSTY